VDSLARQVIVHEGRRGRDESQDRGRILPVDGCAKTITPRGWPEAWSWWMLS